MQVKKSLGQHFLRSEKALRQIIEASEISPSDVVLEIGPGEGVLTERLVSVAEKVIAIEKDDDLIPVLTEKFSDYRNFQLIHHDILDFDAKSIRGSYKLIANIPYYITGQIFRKFLSGEHQPGHMVVLIQREVADRIMARDNKESLLSLSVKAYGTPKYIATVPSGAFAPAPNVDSAILAISNISRKQFDSPEHEQMFFELIHAGFAHKRKQLGGNLSGIVSQDIFQNMNLDPKSRAEDIALTTWLDLARQVVEKHK